MTVLARWIMRRFRVYPRFSRIQSLDLTLREVAKGNGGVNKRRRFEMGVQAVSLGGRSWRQKVDTLKCGVFAQS